MALTNIRQRILAAIILGLMASAPIGVFAKPVSAPRHVQRVTINLTNLGYRPDTFKLRRGVRAYVTFIRRTNDTCGEIVVIPAYGIRQKLPFNQPTTVTFIPRRSGTFNFTCGMDMQRGQIIVS